MTELQSFLLRPLSKEMYRKDLFHKHNRMTRVGFEPSLLQMRAASILRFHSLGRAADVRINNAWPHLTITSIQCKLVSAAWVW